MSRQYVIGSWNNADEYDYSGEQLGSRNAPSKRVHFNPDGTACVGSYSDDETKAKVKLKRSIRHKIVPQQTRLDNIEQMMRDLDAEYAEGGMSAREYAELLLVLQKKHERAYQLLAKAMGWRDEPSQHEAIQDTSNTEFLSTQRSSIGVIAETFNALSVDNVFLRAYNCFQKAKKLFKGK